MIIGLLLAVTVTAWSILLYQHLQMVTLPMAEMWMPPSHPWQWSLTDFAVVYGMWAIMMTAMMLPSAIPMIKAYNKASRQQYLSGWPFTVLFALGYLVIWFLFSVALTGLQWQFHGLHWLTPMMDNNNHMLAAMILMSAGIYQFTGFKNACLNHCRSPLGFLLNHWRRGKQGAIGMGLIHGSYCLGCCWSQMLIMFAVGVMNLTGMVLLTLFILIEKIAPYNDRIVNRSSGALLCLWGIWLIIV